MQIYVNNTELEAELTGEETLREVYDAVSDWTRRSNRYILGVEVDRKITAPDRLSHIAPESVHRVDFHVGDEMEMMADSVGEMDRYVDRIGASLFERTNLTDEEIANLREGVRWISEIIAASCSIMHLNAEEIMCPVVGDSSAESRSVHDILAILRSSVEELSPENSEGIHVFLSILRDLRFFIIKLKMQLLALNADQGELAVALQEFESKIPALIEEIVEVTTLFQSGKDFQALENLDATVERLNAYLSAMFAAEYRLLRDRGLHIPSQSTNGVTFQQVSEDLTGILRDISSAMEENDIVAVGDILEYELTERLSQMPPFLRQLREILIAES